MDALAAAKQMLGSPLTVGRDSGGDGMDGFRGAINHDRRFWPLITQPDVLAVLGTVLSSNIRLLSSHIISLPSVVGMTKRTIRVPGNTGWHRDMYGVTRDLGWSSTPCLAVKCAYYLSPLEPNCGITTILPGSHLLARPPQIHAGEADPDQAITPVMSQGDALLFEIAHSTRAASTNRPILGSPS